MSRPLLVVSTLALSFSFGCSRAAVPDEPRATAKEVSPAQPGLPDQLHLEQPGGPTVTLAENGRAALPIVLAAAATDETKAAAKVLADMLGKITGGTFNIETGDGSSGLVVGTAADFPGVPFVSGFNPKDPAQNELYILRTQAKGLYVVGATPLAVRDAIADLLYRLGYRQFFPSAAWEVLPHSPNLKLSLNVTEKPDYLARRIFFTYGTWEKNQQDFAEWDRKNRMGSSINLNTGHAYGNIIAKNQAAFAAHPEYYTELNGKRQIGPQSKLDVSNPGLRQLVTDFYSQQIEANPSIDSVSVDPSDGGNWGNSPAEEAIGSISDRVTTLANTVADSLNEKFAAQYGTKYVGFYAYNFHSPPPTIKVHPNVVVSVATAFIQGDLSAEELIERWQKQGATIGIREYYAVIHWDHDMPHSARGGSINYLTTTTPKFFKLGARFMTSEASDNWGSCGLGYYLASRMLWDINQAQKVEPLVDDFLTKSFGPAKAPMRQFYGRLYTGLSFSDTAPLSEDAVGNLYRDLDAAWKLADSDAIRARLSELALYVRYVELYRAYHGAGEKDRFKAFEDSIRFAYRIRETHMVHSLAIYRTLYRDNSVRKLVPAEASWKVPEVDKKGVRQNPWKSSEPYTPDQIQSFIKQGIQNNELMPFKPVSFSRNLVPASPLGLAASPRQESQITMRGVQNFYLWMNPGEVNLKVTAGLYYQNRGPVHVELYPVDADEGAAADDEEPADAEAAPIAPIPVSSVDVPPDVKAHEITLKTTRKGLHRIKISDRMMGTTVSWTEATPLTVESSLERPLSFVNYYTMYFYVPPGTKTVGGFGAGRGEKRAFLIDPSGKSTPLPSTSSYVGVPVPAGMDAKLWTFRSAPGSFRLMTVPPYMASSPGELLLPKEVVTR